MSFDDKISIKEEFETPAQIKIEISEFHTTPAEYGSESFESIEVGQEFKSEPLITQIIHDDSPGFSGKKTSKLIYCINCNKTWKYRPGAEKSCRTCKLSFEYKCGKCMKTYSSIISLNRHQAAYCNKLQQKISCDHCNYKTIRKSHLSSHIKSKHLPKNSRSNKCSKCGSCFSWRSDLRRHSKFCGQTNELKYKLLRYSCEHCNYKINQKSDLVKHLQAKHLPRDLSLNKCKKCGKCYSYQAGLRHHLKTCGLSEEEKLSLMSYPCNYCSYKSNKKSNLAAHTKAKH